MGIESRGYMRDGHGYTDELATTGFDPRGWPPVTRGLIVATVVVFALQFLITRRFDPDTLDSANGPLAQRQAILAGGHISIVQEWFELDPRKVLRGQVWRLLTCGFCHQRGSWPIVFNMVLLFGFGRTLERMYGGKEFLLFYLAAILATSLAYLGVAQSLGVQWTSIGAHGAALAVVTLYACHFPREEFDTLVFPVEVRFVAVVVLLMGLLPLFGSLGSPLWQPSLVYLSRLAGPLFALAYAVSRIRLTALTGGGRSKPPVRAVSPPTPSPPRESSAPVLRADAPHQDLDQQVDDILRKVSAEGEAALTDEERRVLLTASQRYKRSQNSS